MSDALALQHPAQTALAVLPTTAVEMLSIAVRDGNTAMVETLARLASEERERHEVIAFNRGMHAAQMEMRPIEADAFNPQTKSKYATFKKLDAALRPIYSRHGFSVSFNTEPLDKPDLVRVIAYVSHQDGHTRTYKIDMPSDGKGAKGGDVMTKTHATGSGVSYGARYLLKMIFNVAVGEDDDDGNGGKGKGARMPETEWIRHRDAIQNARDEKELRALHQTAVKAAAEFDDKQSHQDFSGFANERVRALRNGAQ